MPRVYEASFISFGPGGALSCRTSLTRAVARTVARGPTLSVVKEGVVSSFTGTAGRATRARSTARSSLVITGKGPGRRAPVVGGVFPEGTGASRVSVAQTYGAAHGAREAATKEVSDQGAYVAQATFTQQAPQGPASRKQLGTGDGIGNGALNTKWAPAVHAIRMSKTTQRGTTLAVVMPKTMAVRSKLRTTPSTKNIGQLTTKTTNAR